MESRFEWALFAVFLLQWAKRLRASLSCLKNLDSYLGEVAVVHLLRLHWYHLTPSPPKYMWQYIRHRVIRNSCVLFLQVVRVVDRIGGWVSELALQTLPPRSRWSVISYWPNVLPQILHDTLLKSCDQCLVYGGHLGCRKRNQTFWPGWFFVAFFVRCVFLDSS